MWRTIIIGILLCGMAPICAGAGGDKSKVDAAALAVTLAQGDKFMQQRNYYKAIAAFEKGDKIAHHTCASCLLKLFEAQRRFGDVVSALDTAKKAVKAAGDDKALAAKAHLLRGVLLGQMATKPTDKKYDQAEDELHQSLALDPSVADAHYDLGVLLMRQKRDADGVAELKTFLAANKAETRSTKNAREYIADPRRAREPLAPDFAFAALEGGTVSLAALHGKVALLDFWGTWCPPCRESIPALVRLRKEFGDKPVMLVGISSDTDEQAWREFIVKNRMDWPEFLDTSGAMQTLFAVDSFPTYIVLDGDGVIRFRQSGYGDDTGMFLEDAIKKALKEKPEAANHESVGPESPFHALEMFLALLRLEI